MEEKRERELETRSNIFVSCTQTMIHMLQSLIIYCHTRQITFD